MSEAASGFAFYFLLSTVTGFALSGRQVEIAENRPIGYFSKE